MDHGGKPQLGPKQPGAALFPAWAYAAPCWLSSPHPSLPQVLVTTRLTLATLSLSSQRLSARPAVGVLTSDCQGGA